MLHHLCAGVKGATISKQKVSDDGLPHLCNGLQSPKVEQSTVSPVSNVDTILAVSEGISQCGRKDHAEECWGKNAALLQVTGKASDSSPSSSTLTIMPLWNCRDDRSELAGRAKFLHDLP